MASTTRCYFHRSTQILTDSLIWTISNILGTIFVHRFQQIPAICPPGIPNPESESEPRYCSEVAVEFYCADFANYNLEKILKKRQILFSLVDRANAPEASGCRTDSGVNDEIIFVVF